MDFYHSWFYMHLLNTRWFMWMIIGAVFGINILGPIIMWYVMSGIQLPFTKGKGMKKRETDDQNDPSLS